jgi:outer membrane immunogenic protein
MRQLITAFLGATALNICCTLATLAADMPDRPFMKVPVVADPGFSWSGFYVGGHAGADIMRNANATVDPADALTATHFGADLTNGFIPRSYSTDRSGFVGGAQLGYNWQMRNYVFGLESDLSIPSAKGHQEIDFPGIPQILSSAAGTFDAEVLWFGTARARLGALVNPGLLAYATGGLAYGSVRRQFSWGFPIVGPIEQTFADHTVMSWGWAAGTGFEWAVAGHLTIRGEYQFVRLEGNSFTYKQRGRLLQFYPGAFL